MRVHRAGLGDPALKAAWGRLETAGALRTPFEAAAFYSSLHDVPGLSARVQVLVVTDADDGVVGLLPLEWPDGPARLRTVSTPAAGWLAPDHLDVIAVPAQRPAVAGAVVRHLCRRPDWDLLDLHSLRSTGALAAALGAARPVLRLSTEPVRCPYLDLRGGPEGLPWSRNLRQQVARGRRAAERAGGGFEVVDEPDRVVALLEVLMTLHVARFGTSSQAFSTPSRREFHRLAAGRLAAAGRARIYRLTVTDRDAGLLYAFTNGHGLYYYAMGIRPEVGGSPGLTVLGQTALAAAKEGLREFDLLRGDHEFKLRFSSGVRDNPSRRLLRPTVQALRFAVVKTAGRIRNRLPTGRPPEGAPQG